MLYEVFPFVNRLLEEEAPIYSGEEGVYGGKRIITFPVSGLYSPLFPGKINAMGLQCRPELVSLFYSDRAMGESRNIARLCMRTKGGEVLPDYTLCVPGLSFSTTYEPNIHGPPRMNGEANWGDIRLHFGFNTRRDIWVRFGKRCYYLEHESQFCVEKSRTGHAVRLERRDFEGIPQLRFGLSHPFSSEDGHGITIQALAEFDIASHTHCDIVGVLNWMASQTMSGDDLNPGVALVNRINERHFSSWYE